MKLKFILLMFSVICFTSCKNKEKNVAIIETEIVTKAIDKPALEIYPIEHASAVVKYGNTIIYMDPTLGAEPYKNYGNANFIVITDIHGDHMNTETLKDLDLSASKIIVPKAVADKLPQELNSKVTIINNGDIIDFGVFKIEAIPMYNLREEALKFHEKGRGNGYVFTFGDERVYFSGDTEDIPEMRALKNIDKAFICMNLPYTMTVESAASAVIEFKPKQVYPYHYRGQGGLSDVEKFRNIVNEANLDIEVVQLDWYPKS